MSKFKKGDVIVNTNNNKVGVVKEVACAGYTVEVVRVHHELWIGKDCELLPEQRKRSKVNVCYYKNLGNEKYKSLRNT